MDFQTCPTCRGQRFIEAPILSFRFLLGFPRTTPGTRPVCHQCQGVGLAPNDEGIPTVDIDLDQPSGFQSTATFAYFVDEPQSTALKEQAASRRQVLETA